ncbi:Na+/H+ antiporter NhaC [Natranaerobius thermophilus]|uniref:Na+/H+ antiporter NhaC n=1 Tax=Natranaerobius thermophilus (strain ATCC BAA-1301 / DSM 18059 / JW/NM-WN-LF) TaxID=457570 RepID=B2A2A0_NATTJ|nr:Na+/H+ antiporter NhaC [Natranaerobius thermophilus]ACB86206.1 Na+/H+ antiporter NhaC [Natranaerobius thermophilus JW/NM-WN-LF]
MGEVRKPSIGEVLVVLIAFLVVVFSFVAIYDLPIQLALFISWFIVIALGLRLGYSYADLEDGIKDGIREGLGAIFILIAVGALIGTWISGGIIGTLIYYGLAIIHPSIFLLATLIITSLTSLATGTSWGSAGTSGIAMMGIGAGFGYPLPLVAGAVLSGVYFGDKLSPLSDSTNLTASMCKIDVIEHVRSMIYLIVPAWVISGILYTVVGFTMDVGTAPEEIARVEEYMQVMQEYFVVNPAMLIPAVVVIALLILRKPPVASIAFGSLLGVIWATLFQGMNFFEALGTAYDGFAIDTGVEFIDDLLSRGGIYEMLSSIAVIMFGLGFGGLLEKIGALRVIVEKVAFLFSNQGRASIGSIIVGVMGNMFGSAMYVSLIVPPKIMQGSYDELKLKRTVLSRNSEVGGTLTSAMVPWSDNGIFMATLLGVSVFEYIPFMWLALISILLSIIYGYTGMFMWKTEEADN